MQTIIGRFATAHDMDAALSELHTVHFTNTSQAAQTSERFGDRFLASGLNWDAITIISMVGGVILCGIIGLLAGHGAFGGVPHPTGRSLLAGLCVGISLGMLLGFIGGTLWGFLKPSAKTIFQPTAVVGDDYYVTVETPERFAPAAITVMRHAHAAGVETREGHVTPQQLAA